MKIIAISDIHEDITTIKNYENIFKNADLILIAGDFTNKGDKKVASEILSNIENYNNNILGIIGNLDSYNVLDLLIEKKYSIHKTNKNLDSISVFGFGGSNITPFSTRIEYTEEEISDGLKKAYENILSLNIKIMLSHTPPYNSKLDVINSGVHVGSKAVRKFIEENEIDICICGHIHESKASDVINDTLCFNPGAFSLHSYVNIEINKKNDIIIDASLKSIL